MNKEVFKQLVKSGLLGELEQVIRNELSIIRSNYKPGSKSDKTIASDVKGFIYAEEAISMAISNIKGIELELKKEISYK